MTRLEGGFVNTVYLIEGEVVKEFGNDNLVGVSSARRILNESLALSIFGDTIAPRLLFVNGTCLHQEFVQGESYEVKARRGERVFKTAGSCLRKVHDKCHGGLRLNSYYQARFDEAVKAAAPILRREKISPKFQPSWSIVEEWGSKYIHGDFWLGNVIGKDSGSPKVIDWEFSGIGSPFEDFAIVELWIFREFPGSSEEFWDGYGILPDQSVIDSFLILRCVEFIATTKLRAYVLEEEDGFYHNKISVLRSLCSGRS